MQGHKTGGRRKGTPNKATAEIRRCAQALFDAAYWQQRYKDLHAGTLHPAIEAKLLAYGFGEPKQVTELSGTVQTVAQVIHKHVTAPSA